MNLLFITGGQYPDGGAASNRQMAYAKGLVELNHDVTFILLSAQKSSDAFFVHDNIKFISTLSPDEKSAKNNIAKIYSTYQAILSARKKLAKLQSESKIDAVILLDAHVWILFPFLRHCKKKAIKVFHERTEYPFVVERRGILGSIHNKIYLSFILPKFDGLYVISLALKKYFNEITKNKIPVSVINMVVDPERFNAEEKGEYQKTRYLAYCGNMDIEKDGIDILIRSFGQALNQFDMDKTLQLMLIGNNSNKVLQQELERVIDESKCSGNVIFTGLVSRQKIPGYLLKADALALARTVSKQAEGGFPTKLGEYLTTGKPVIVTDVGEIGLFLKDGENAFVAKADSIESFSEKIIQVFNHYPEALKVGLNGKNLVYNEFNYLTQARNLAGFIESVIYPKI